MTEEEIKMLIAEAERAGVLETGEHRMISGVLRLGDRPVRGLMTPRTDVDWIDVTDDADRIRERILTTTHSRLPVGEGNPDNNIGSVTTRELLASAPSLRTRPSAAAGSDLVPLVGERQLAFSGDGRRRKLSDCRAPLNRRILRPGRLRM